MILIPTADVSLPETHGRLLMWTCTDPQTEMLISFAVLFCMNESFNMQSYCSLT